MQITAPKLAEILLIPEKAAKLLLERPANLDEKMLRANLKQVVPISEQQRAWVWEVHKQCDQLLHQRLASFTAAQAMTLAAFTLLTVARFNADPERIAWVRIQLLDVSRIIVVIFGAFLAGASAMVTYSMFLRLNYLNDKFLFRDRVYDSYYLSIGWMVKYYRYIIPFWLPVAEGLLWTSLLALLIIGIWLDTPHTAHSSWAFHIFSLEKR